MEIKNLIANDEVKNYFTILSEKIDLAVSVARNAKKTGRDISDDIESVPAAGIAEKTEILVGPVGVAKIYNELWD